MESVASRFELAPGSRTEQLLAWCCPYGVSGRSDAPPAKIEALLREVNRETQAAIERLLPQDAHQFLSLALSPQERGEVHGVTTAKRLRRTLAEPIRSILDRGGKCWRSYTIAACCTAVGGDFHGHLDWLALPELLHVGSLIVDDVEDESVV